MNEDRAAKYHRLKRRASVASLAASVTVPALLLSGGAEQLRTWSAALSGGAHDAPGTVAIFSLGLILLMEAIGLPAAWYRSFLLERRFNLSSQRLTGWVSDHVKATAVAALLAVGAAQVVYGTLSRWPRAWWLIAALALAGGVALLSRLAPVVLLPLFYRFTPLDRPSLGERVAALSRKAGVPVLGVFEWSLGEKTRRANAALVGAGSTRRILLSDTLLAEYSDDEIEVILAHELGHHVHRDILKAIGLEAVLLLAAFGAAALALATWWRPLGLSEPSDVAGLPLLMLSGGAVMLLATPLVHAFSRASECRADRYALQLTDRPLAFISAMRRLAAQNLAEERPSRLALWLFHSHPPIAARIAAAQSRLGQP